MKLSIIIPAYNEEATIEQIIYSVHNNCYRFCENFEIVVYDDGSTDKTLAKALDVKNRLDTVKLTWWGQNKGKGCAIRQALKRADGDVVIIQDADLEYNPQDYEKLLVPFEKWNADAVYGSRFLGAPHRSLYFWHQLANDFLTFLTNLVCNLNLTDMETGLKAFRVDKLKLLDLKENDFRFEPEVTIKLAQAKARIYEVAVSYNGRTYAEGKKIRWYDGLKAIWCILKWGILAQKLSSKLTEGGNKI